MCIVRTASSDLERYYAELTAAPATVKVHHAFFHRALKKAVRDHLLSVNRHDAAAAEQLAMLLHRR